MFDKNFFVDIEAGEGNYVRPCITIECGPGYRIVGDYTTTTLHKVKEYRLFETRKEGGEYVEQNKLELEMLNPYNINLHIKEKGLTSCKWRYLDDHAILISNDIEEWIVEFNGNRLRLLHLVNGRRQRLGHLQREVNNLDYLFNIVKDHQKYKEVGLDYIYNASNLNFNVAKMSLKALESYC